MAKKNTFKEWRESQQKETIVLIRKALMILARATYNNITRLAKDVAALVTEFEKHANALLPVEKQKEIHDVSYTTLLRNKAYKNILEVALAEQNPTKGNLPAQQGLTEQDILRVENSNLKESIKQLQTKIRKIDSGEPNLIESTSGGIDTKKEQMVSDIQFLIQLAINLHNQIKGAFETIQEENTDEDRSIPGLYGPSGLVMTFDGLDRYGKLQDEYLKRK